VEAWRAWQAEQSASHESQLAHALTSVSSSSKPEVVETVPVAQTLRLVRMQAQAGADNRKELSSTALPLSTPDLAQPETVEITRETLAQIIQHLERLEALDARAVLRRQ
jgi:hypothetical protein